MIKMLIILLFVVIFHVKIQQKTTNLLFCVVFVLIKLSQHEIPKNNFCLNNTIILYWYHVVSFHVVGQKKCYGRPLDPKGFGNWSSQPKWSDFNFKSDLFGLTILSADQKCQISIVLTISAYYFSKQEGHPSQSPPIRWLTKQAAKINLKSTWFDLLGQITEINYDQFDIENSCKSLISYELHISKLNSKQSLIS